MLKSYKNPNTPRKRQRYERTVFEGIFQAMSANQGELMLAATEEKLLNMKTGEERTVGIYLEPIVLRMDTIATAKFIGQNITRSGLVPVESKPDVPKPKMHRSVTYIQSPPSSSVVSEKKPRRDSGTPDGPVVGLQASENQVLMDRESTAVLPSIDDILASKLRPTPKNDDVNADQQPTCSQQYKKQTDSGQIQQRRTLQKFKFDQPSDEKQETED